MPEPKAQNPSTPTDLRWLWLSILSGLLLGFSQPIVIEPINGTDALDVTGLTGALAFIGYVPALWAMRNAGPKRAYAIGFVTCFVHFAIVVHWLVYAMVIFGGIPVIASVAVLALLATAMAAYVAAAFAISRIITGRSGLPTWIVFPAALCAVELLRNYGPLGGFPWGNVGYSFATIPALMQGAALFGVHGLVFVAALVNVAIVDVMRWFGGKRRLPRSALVTAILMVLLVGWGIARTEEPGNPKSIKVAMLQGNIEQGVRNLNDVWTGRKVLDRYHKLQDEALAKGAQLVIWPEAAFPIRIQRDVKSFEPFSLVAPGGRVPPAAVVGAVAYANVTDAEGKPHQDHHNSAFVIGADQAVLSRTDKTHLVPFGEYIPWPLASIVRQIVPIGGTVPGNGFRPTKIRVGDHDLKIGVTICYEGVFPEITRAYARAGADFMVNVTNDSWYGISSATLQHSMFYAMRATESGRPVARAANTGASAWFDTRGRVHNLTEMYTDEALVADIPLDDGDTLFVTLGEWVALPCLLFVLGVWFIALLGPGAIHRKRARIDSWLGVGGLVVGFFTSLVYLGGGVHEEATSTRALLVVLAGFLVGIGALSGRPWGRKAQLWVGGITAVLGGVAVAVGHLPSLAFVFAGAVLFAVQFRRASEYTRAADPLVHLGR